MQRLLRVIVSTLLRILTNQEAVMADFTKLNQDIADLSAKVDALLAKQNPPPVDEQPAVDQAAAAVEAIAAKIPA
ncbi:phage gp36-like protein [Bradyrhizobium sp. JR18.2]